MDTLFKNNNIIIEKFEKGNCRNRDWGNLVKCCVRGQANTCPGDSAATCSSAVCDQTYLHLPPSSSMLVSRL